MAEKIRERTVEIGATDGVIDDPEAPEHGLVEVPFDRDGCGAVEGVTVLTERQDVTGNPVEIVPGGFAGTQDPPGRSEGLPDAGLFLLEEVVLDRPGVERSHEHSAFVFQGGDVATLPDEFGVATLRDDADRVPDGGRDLVALGCGERDAGPVVLDPLFDDVDRYVGLSADPMLPATAVEVRVDPAALAACVHDADA